MDWITTGNNFGETAATQEFRQAIIDKILSSNESTPILYYKDLKGPSHATVVGYLIRNKQLLGQQPKQRKSQPKQKTLDDYVNEFEDLIKFFGDRVVKDKNFSKNHTYWVVDEDGKKHKAVSVTQYIKGEPSSSDGTENPSLSIGNSFDKFVRDYFDGKDVRKSTYRNIPKSSSKNGLRDKLIQQLDDFKEALDQRFGKGKYKVITKEFPIGGKIGNKYVAGTADMYVIDDKGNIYIFDMKTYSSDKNFEKSLNSIYPAQVSLYAQLIGQNLPAGSTLQMSD